MIQAAEEVAALAAAQGIALPYLDAGHRALAVAQGTAANRSSMAQDLARGAPTEIESITGEVVRLAGLHGTAVPVNKALLRLMRTALAGRDWREEAHRLPYEVRPAFQALAAEEIPAP
jgi:ketopantoate reductase